MSPSPSFDNEENFDHSEEPVYRGSIAHVVLQRIDYLDAHRVQEDPYDVEAHREGDLEILEAHHPGEARADSDEGPDAAEEIRPKVLPQPRLFSKGDRVTVQGEGPDQHTEIGKIILFCDVYFYRLLPPHTLSSHTHFVGFIVEKLPRSWYIVQSEDSFTSWTLHSSQMRRRVDQVLLDDVLINTRGEVNSPTSEITSTFWNCLEDEIRLVSCLCILKVFF
jgi:hypothetical protein